NRSRRAERGPDARVPSIEHAGAWRLPSSLLDTYDHADRREQRDAKNRHEAWGALVWNGCIDADKWKRQRVGELECDGAENCPGEPSHQAKHNWFYSSDSRPKGETCRRTDGYPYSEVNDETEH